MGFGEKLRAAIDRVRGTSALDRGVVKEAVKDLQRALISADVPVEAVMRLSKKIEQEAFKEELPKGLTRREHVIKTVHDSLVGILGGKHEAPKKPKKILLVGLYGFGKTTTAGKIARYYSKRGMKAAVVCADTFRPAAYEQLKQVAEKAGVEFFGIDGEKSSKKVVEAAMKALGKRDLIICDSAGRNALDAALVSEMKEISKAFAPDEIWLVMAADIGQLAGKQASAFHGAVGVNGIVITRTDGSAKGGGALAACAATKAPVYFIGTGEKIDDIEEFDATRYLGRVMGYGDLKGLLEKAREAEVGEEVAMAIESGEFSLQVFYEQLKAAKKLGPLSKVMEMAGLGMQIPKEQLEIGQEKLDGFGVILDSMTGDEKLNPELLNKGRIARIAKGSGKSQEDVRELIKHYKQMRGMFKKLKGFTPEKISKKGLDLGSMMKKFGKKKKLKIR